MFFKLPAIVYIYPIRSGVREILNFPLLFILDQSEAASIKIDAVCDLPYFFAGISSKEVAKKKVTIG